MRLKEYKKKRKFDETPEPGPKIGKPGKALRFVIQKHQASHLHYDFRLEWNGVLKSWAVPKGPSTDPEIKRLAMMVEDHPYDYRTFEGIIPEGNYGAGTVMIWDEGTYEPLEDMTAGLRAGKLSFTLSGKKLRGRFALVRSHRDEKSWFLFKASDRYASKADITKKDKSAESGRTMNQIADRSKKNGKIWKSNRDSGSEPMPHGVKPMLATLVKDPFNNKDWIFEIKWDGYRAVAEVDHGKASLYSRNNLSFNKTFAPIVEALEKIKHQAIFDGEVVVVDENGKSHFQFLQNYQKTKKGNLVYYVFDLLYLDGRDLTSWPLLKRKETLKKLLEQSARGTGFSNIRYSDHIVGSGVEFFKTAKKAGLEGIMAKNGTSAYAVGHRSRDWMKIKTALRQEAVIVGYTDPKGSRRYLGSLILALKKGNDFVYAGHSGGGFTQTNLKEIYGKLKALSEKTSPLSRVPKGLGNVHWVKPKLVLETAFAEWTDEKTMRHPIFLGLRPDKPASEVTIEKPT